MTSSAGSLARPGEGFRIGFAVTLGLDLVSRALGAVTLVILIRALSVPQYALITMFFAIGQFAASAGAGGIRTRYLREEAERHSRRLDPSGSSVADALARSCVAVGAVTIVMVALGATVGLGGRIGGDAALGLYAGGYATAWSLAELSIARLQARRRFGSAGAVSLLRAAAVTVAAVVVAIRIPGPPGAPLVFITAVGAVGVVALVSAARADHVHIPRLRALGLTLEERWLSLYYVFAAAFAFVDVLIASVLLGDHEVATLGATLRYLAVALGALPALGAVLRVRTSQADIVDSPTRQRAMIHQWVKRTVLPVGLFVAGLIAIAPYAVPLVDHGRYPGSVVALQIYLLTVAATYITALGPSILMAQRRYAVLASLYAAAVVVNLVGDVAVARVWGVVGIAGVSTAAFVTLDVALLVVAARGRRSNT